MEENSVFTKTLVVEFLKVPVAQFFKNGEDMCPPITVADAITKTAALEPKKSQYGTVHCPCCDGIVNEWHHYCPDCGQRLDWRDCETKRRDGNVIS